MPEKRSLNLCPFLFIFVGLFALSRANIYQLSCMEDYKECSLASESGNQLRVQNLKCIDKDCKDTFLVADDDKWYVCEHSDKKQGKCSKLFKTNTLQLQSALLDLLIENSGSAIESLFKNTDSKRALPFETLNYGRRKRYLPFETLNYGKRSESGCDCSQEAKRALPFETLLYGKRALPFETLNYGKRAYIPIDGYIMGRREEDK